MRRPEKQLRGLGYCNVQGEESLDPTPFGAIPPAGVTLSRRAGVEADATAAAGL